MDYLYLCPQWGKLCELQNIHINDLSPYNLTSLPSLIELYYSRVINTAADLPLTNFAGIAIGPPAEIYNLFRFVKIDLVTTIFDMLLHSSSEGKITDGLELLGDIYKTNQAHNKYGYSKEQLFASISKFSNYDFINFFNGYVVDGDVLNIDYENSRR